MAAASSVEQVTVCGYPLQPWHLTEAVDWCLAACQTAAPQLLVTLNPEIIVQAQHDAALHRALRAADVHVADGIGVLWAVRLLAAKGAPLPPERIPGVELAEAIMARAGHDVAVYFLGAKPGVAARAAEVMHARYGIRVAGHHHGYFARQQEAAQISQQVRASGAQLLLAGLGEGQETFLHQQRAALGVPLMIGVGGALDVFAGAVQRTPAWTRRLNVEWAYRVGLEPKRWHRAPRLARFLLLVLREALG